MSQNLISFFVTISRLAIKQTRTDELQKLLDKHPAKKVFADLKIEVAELIALIKIAFNLLEGQTILLTLCDLSISR